MAISDDGDTSDIEVLVEIRKENGAVVVRSKAPLEQKISAVFIDELKSLDNSENSNKLPTTVIRLPTSANISSLPLEVSADATSEPRMHASNHLRSVLKDEALTLWPDSNASERSPTKRTPAVIRRRGHSSVAIAEAKSENRSPSAGVPLSATGNSSKTKHRNEGRSKHVRDRASEIGVKFRSKRNSPSSAAADGGEQKQKRRRLSPSTMTIDVDRCTPKQLSKRCELCGKVFYDRSTRNRHVTNIHTIVPTTQSGGAANTNNCKTANKFAIKACKLNDSAFGLSPSDRLQQFECIQCSNRFNSVKGLRQHLFKAHSTGKQYDCDICDQSFSLKMHCIKHRLTAHTGEKPYACGSCGKPFAQYWSLESHYRTAHCSKV